MNRVSIVIGDIVEVIGTDSIPKSFLGKRGKVTGMFFNKFMVEFIPRVGATGSLSHTVVSSDLKKVNVNE